MSRISLENYLAPLLKLFQDEQATGSWLLLSVLVVIIVLLRMGGRHKGKITTGRMVGTAEKLAAVNTALKQIRERKHDRVTLWCGKPRYWFKGSLRGLGTRLQTLLGTPPTIYLPDAQRSTLVIGTPGSGKTASVIDSALESAFVQGFPVILYDKKGS